MSETIPLDPGIVAGLLPLPRAVQAVRLLTTVGPLADNGAEFEIPTADLAYLVFLGWLRTPLRDGRPGYEGWNLTCARVRAAMQSCPPTPAAFGSAILGRLGTSGASLVDADRLWWRRTCAEMPRDVWRRLRRRDAVEDVLSAAGFLRSWLFEIRAPSPAVAPTTSLDLEPTP